MSDDEAVARAIVTQQRDLRDEVFKATYLPWREGQARLEAAEQRQKSIKSGPMVLFAALYPSLKNTMAVETRLERGSASFDSWKPSGSTPRPTPASSRVAQPGRRRADPRRSATGRPFGTGMTGPWP